MVEVFNKKEKYPVNIKKGNTIRFNYANWRGVCGVRNAVIDEIYYGSNKYHPNPQFLMKAYDLDKNVDRVFAMADMSDLEIIE